MRFTIATYNIHKGFSQLNRRMVIHELRDRLVGLDADILFLQEVVGEHERHAARHVDWPVKPQHEFIADSVWQEVAYGKNAVYRARPPRQRGAVALPDRRPREPGHLGASVRKPRACCTARSGWARSGPSLHCINVHLGLFERGRQWQLRALCERIASHGAQGCAADDRRRLQRLAAQGEPHAGRRARRRGGVRVRQGPPRADVSLGAADVPARPHLRPRPRHRRRARPLRVSPGAAVRSRGARPRPSRRPSARDEPLLAGQPRGAAAQRRRVLPGAGRGDRRAPSARSGSRPTSTPTTSRAATSPRR